MTIAAVHSGPATESDADPGDAVPTLADLLSGHAPGMLELQTAPAGRTVVIRGVRLIGAGSAQASRVHPGDLVLAIGTVPDGAAGRAWFQDLRTAGAVGIVVRAGSCDPRRLTAASEAGLAVLSVAAHISWELVHAVLRNRIATAGTGHGAEQGENAQPRDLQALTEALAAAVGGPVTIEDLNSQVLAYAVGSVGLDELDEPRRQSILRRRTPDEWIRRFSEVGVHRRFWAGEPLVRIDEFADLGLRSRLVAPIRAGVDLLGSIWIAEAQRTLGPDAERAVLEAAQLAASILVRTRTADLGERSRRTELLRTLLSGQPGSGVAATHLGVEDTNPVVLAFGALDGAQLFSPIEAERVAGLVWFAAEAASASAACACIDGVCYALLPRPVTLEESKELARTVLDQAAATFGIELRAAVGTATGAATGTAAGAAVGGVPGAAARADADRVLALMGASTARVAGADDVRPQAWLAEASSVLARQPQLTSAKLARLREYDDEHGSDYVTSLVALLDAFGDLVLASDRLGVHPNTFRYRVRRLTEVSGIRLGDPDERLACTVELSLQR